MRQNPLKIAIAGLGTVGSSVAKHIVDKGNLQGYPVNLVAVSARSQGKDRGFSMAGVQWFDDTVEMAKNSEVDVVVELIGGESGVALEVCETALNAGKGVITANKAMLAKHGKELAVVAEQKGATLYFEAAVAGGIPAIKVLRESIADNSLSAVAGILNGTSNFILSKMSDDGLSYDAALQQAQELGYAEADPTLDVNGMDACQKLSILASIGFGAFVDADDVECRGIDSVQGDDIAAAKELGFVIKHLAIATKTDGEVACTVRPFLVPLDNPVARVNGVTNTVVYKTGMLGALQLTGPGAGGDATASSVLSDVLDIARGHCILLYNQPAEQLQKARVQTLNLPMQFLIRGVGLKSLEQLVEKSTDSAVLIKPMTEKELESTLQGMDVRQKLPIFPLD